VLEGNPGVLTPEQIAQRLKELAALKIHPRDQLENRTLLARAERVYQQLRGDPRDWLGQQIMVFESALTTQDKRVVVPAFDKLAAQLDSIEADAYIFTDPLPSQ
jgi:molecular chaperone HscC